MTNTQNNKPEQVEMEAEMERSRAAVQRAIDALTTEETDSRWDLIATALEDLKSDTNALFARVQTLEDQADGRENDGRESD